MTCGAAFVQAIDGLLCDAVLRSGAPSGDVVCMVNLDRAHVDVVHRNIIVDRFAHEAWWRDIVSALREPSPLATYRVITYAVDADPSLLCRPLRRQRLAQGAPS